MKRLLGALALALVLSGCVQTTAGGPPGTSSQGWYQIAVGAGQVIGQTKADAQVAKASAKLAEYCGILQTVAAGATIFAPEKQQKVAAMAAAGVNAVCEAPPADVAAALLTAVRTYEAVEAARKGV